MKIAFLDYKLENFHANTFRDLIASGAQTGAQTGANAGARLHAASSLDHESGCQWAEKAGVPYLHDIRELKGEVDGVMVLAPSDPALHLQLAEQAVALGVPVYVDKTFAATLADAEAIFALADKAGVPLFSTSALRCADELKPLREWDLLQAQAYGGGGNFAEYMIHPLEMLISLFGSKVSDVALYRTGELRQITLSFGDRVGTLFCYPNAQRSYQIVAAREDEVLQQAIASPIFPNLLRDILHFFATGEEPVCRKETLKIIELVEKFTQ